MSLFEINSILLPIQYEIDLESICSPQIAVKNDKLAEKLISNKKSDLAGVLYRVGSTIFPYRCRVTGYKMKMSIRHNAGKYY